MATYNDIKKIKIGDNTFVFHVPTASEVGALPSSTTIPAITLNGAANTSPSFYAPTTAGTNGYVLKSNGSGAPTWTSATLTDEKVTTAALTSGTLYYPILATGTGTATRQIDSTLKGLTYKSKAGTTTTGPGSATLILGNNLDIEEQNDEFGELILYGVTAYSVSINCGFPSDNRILLLPDKDGTLATTDLANASNRGLMSNTDKIYLDGLSDAIGTTSSTITIKNGSSGGRAFYLETSSSDSDDTSLISAITSLGWDSDVIVS